MKTFFYYWNRFFFKTSLNVFDFLCIMTISSLVSNYGWQWMLAYVITIPLSVHMQRRLGFE